MRGAFVLQFGQAFQSGRRLEGWIEEVDTGKQFRFRSIKAMVRFIGQCLRASIETADQTKAQRREPMNIATTHREISPVEANDRLEGIDETLEALVAAWNRHDVTGYLSHFAADADFVNVFGHHHRGRLPHEAELSWLHADMFSKSVIRILEAPRREVSPGVVICPLHWEMRGHKSFPGQAEVCTGVLTLVFVRRGNQWQIAAAQNTDFVKVPRLGI